MQKFFKVLSFIAVFAMGLGFVNHVKAQTYPSDWTTDDISFFKEHSTKEQQKFVESLKIKEMKGFPITYSIKSVKTQFSYSSFIKQTFASVFAETEYFKSWDEEQQIFGAIIAGLGFNGNIGSDILEGYYARDGKLKRSIKVRLNSTKLVENQLNDLLPLIKVAWTLMDDDQQNIYQGILLHMEKYVKGGFDYKAEMQKLMDEEESFIESEEHSYREVEAFVFRRIRDAKQGNGDWTTSWLLKMIKKVKRSLKIK